jgi:hypothetical protein
VAVTAGRVGGGGGRNCGFLKAVAIDAPGKKKRSDAAVCRQHLQRLFFYAEVLEHVCRTI